MANKARITLASLRNMYSYSLIPLGPQVGVKDAYRLQIALFPIGFPPMPLRPKLESVSAWDSSSQCQPAGLWTIAIVFVGFRNRGSTLPMAFPKKFGARALGLQEERQMKAIWWGALPRSTYPLFDSFGCPVYPVYPLDTRF